MDAGRGVRLHGSTVGTVRAWAAIAALLAAAVLLAGVSPDARASEPAAGTPSSSPVALAAASFGSYVWSGPLLYGSSDSATTQLARGPSGSIYSVTDVGVTWSPDHSVMSVARLRVSDGHVIWRKTYAGPGVWASATRVASAPNGDVVVLGYERETADAGASWFVRRYRASRGKLLWSRTRSSGSVAGKPTDTTAYGLAVDGAGNVYVAGTTLDSSDSPGVAIAARYSAAGRLSWTRSLPSGAGGMLNGIAVDAHGSSYVTGCVRITASTPTIAVGVVARLSTTGRVVWTKPIGNNGFFQTTQPIIRGGSLFVRGLRWVEDPPNATLGWPLVAKVATATGKPVWLTTLDAVPGTMQQPQGFAVDAGGNPVIGGASQSVVLPGEPGVSYMGWVYKLNGRTGALAWHQWFFNDIGTDGYSGFVDDVAVDGQGRIYVGGGWAPDATTQGTDGIVARYDPAGGSRKLWRITGDATGWSDCRALLVAGGVFAGGAVEMTTGQTSFIQRLKP
jgi:hypothetical protein